MLFCMSVRMMDSSPSASDMKNMRQPLSEDPRHRGPTVRCRDPDKDSAEHTRSIPGLEQVRSDRRTDGLRQCLSAASYRAWPESPRDRTRFGFPETASGLL